MQDIFSLLNGLRRPSLLISAARHGVQDYRRASHLPRILGPQRLPKPGEAALKLMEIEQGLNELRKSGSADYSLMQHVNVLIALMGEAQLLRASLPKLT